MLFVSNLTSSFVNSGSLYHVPAACQVQTRHTCELDGSTGQSPKRVLVSGVPDWLVPDPYTPPLILDSISVWPPQYHFPSCDVGEASAGLQLHGVRSSSVHLAKTLADVGGEAAPAAGVCGALVSSLRGGLRKECRVKSLRSGASRAPLVPSGLGLVRRAPWCPEPGCLRVCGGLRHKGG